MKILTISPNNIKNNINSILSSNIDSLIINSNSYNDYIESINDELDEIFDTKSSFIYYSEMNNPNEEINNIFKNEIININDKIKFNENNKILNSINIHINDDYNYVIYINNGMYDLIKNNYIKEDDINNKYMNLLSTYLKYDYNIKNEILLGNVYLIKYDNQHNIVDINKKDFNYLLFNNIFFTYFSGYCNDIVFASKFQFKSVIFNDIDNNENYKILEDKKLVIFIKDNIKTIFKYNLNFEKQLNNDVKKYYIEFTDKYNLLITNSVKNAYSWDNILKDDIINLV